MRWIAYFLPIVISAFLETSAVGEIVPPGHRPVPHAAHVLINARIVVSPGQVITNGVIVIRRDRIEAVGPGLPIPSDARVWNMAGTTLYAGLIEPYLVQGGQGTAVNTSQFMPIAESRNLTAGSGPGFFGVAGGERDPGSPGVGHDLPSMTPERRLAAQFVPDAKAAEELRELGFTAACVVPEKGILRGQSVLVSLSEAPPNDLVLRADVFQHAAFDAESGRENGYPKSLMGVIAAWRQVMLDASHHQALRQDFARNPQSRTRPEVNPAFEALEPVLSQAQRLVFEPGSVLMMDRAARLAREMGIDAILVASGQEWRRPDLIRQLGFPVIIPLMIPAPPKFTQEDDWQQLSLDMLRAWDWAPENPVVLIRQAALTGALTTHGLGERPAFRKNLRKVLDRGLTEDEALAALTTVPARLCGIDGQLGTLTPGKLAHILVVDGNSYFDPEAQVRGVWIDGILHSSKAELEKDPKESKDGDKAKAKKDAPAPDKVRIARSPMEDRGPLTQPATVLVEGATLWTCGPAGRIEKGSLLIQDGRITAVGKTVMVPETPDVKLIRIDGTGLHVTPGLIDAHNHSMILGGVNEATLPSTAMVRIGDVINSEAGTIHQQLAGGLTVANELHGSANPIGGQNAIIKLRDGASPEDLKFKDAPQGIKFALGENVKQSNWGERNTTRFPQTRMGVGTFYMNRFTAARQYLAGWDAFRKSGGAPPRRDLELEAIGEILQGRRWIHCHSYRQDEILAFLRQMEEFGVQVGTLQHVLEGYKVADEIARHGAGGSCFSDWWAYKFEVYDAIPHAGSLMQQRGVLVSFNSDSSDLARRMNLEAAKAVKYGGTTEEEALKFVTINPARQLRIDRSVGSLEVGKDGDFALWSASPLDTAGRCLETWIEGRRYFSREREATRSEALATERQKLLEKLRATPGAPEPAARADAARAAFFRNAWETSRHSEVMGCQDCLRPRNSL